MSAFPAASRPSRHTAIAILLCILALSFAMEAKLAGYGPVEGPGSSVRAAKAMPADTPELVRDGVPAPGPLHPQFPVVLLVELAAVLLFGKSAFERRRAAGSLAQIPAMCHLYPGIFFRPPPAC
ncbi:MAG: hypothetical protein ACRD27_06090 [Terracidiphilus sp.]